MATTTEKRFGNFDWSLFSVTLVVCIVGLLTLYSSTYRDQMDIFYKQLIYMAVGLGMALALTLIDYRIFERLAYPIYGVTLFLLMLVSFIGKTALGSQRWLPLGPIHLQPSELIKVAIVIVLARFYSVERPASQTGYGFRELMPVFALVGLPILFIFKQPDLGTAMMVAFVSGTLIFFCNLKMKTLFIMVTTCLIVAPLSYQFVLKEYQRDRVRTFLDPMRDPKDKGYHAVQSMITVGSGQFIGKGYKKGTQSKLEFLPKHHTDFIFSSFAEEWGFMGSFVVLSLFALLVLLGADVVRKAKEKFGSVLAMGALSIILWHVLVNIGMEIGLLPVVGVPMPFFSYGGSALFTNMIAFGILLSVSLRRHIF